MTAVNRLTEEQIEKLAVEVRQFLIDHEMWQFILMASALQHMTKKLENIITTIQII